VRILYLHPNAWTGEPVLLRALARKGHEVCVLEEHRGLAGRRDYRSYFLEPADGLRTLWYDPGRGAEKILTWGLDRFFKRSFEGRNLVHRMWVIRDALQLFHPDVVVCSDGFSYAIPAAFLKRLGLMAPKLVVSYIGGDVLDCPEAGVGKSRERLTGWLIRSSVKVPDLLRPVSPKVRDVLLEEGADPKRMRVIPTHLPAELQTMEAMRVRRAALQQSIRAHHGILPAAPLVITLGANHKGKGLQTLAEAWPRVLERSPDARWLLCGPDHPWLGEAVWPLIEKAGVRQTVMTVSGQLARDAVFEHLAAADLHINPSLCESLNMVTVEAAAVGTPTITSDGAGICAWVERLQCGAVVPRLRAGDLADAIIRALDSAALRRRWTDACGGLAAEFLPERVAGQLLEAMAQTDKRG
jgi:glycosyltransferase involved in cell wall biosynthesis